MNYYPHHIGDYAAATAHLSALEDCFYRRMLDRYYQTEQPLPADIDALSRVLRARDKLERAAVEVVANEFFELDGDVYRHCRCDEEIAGYVQRAETAKENGRRGGRPKKPKPNPDHNPEITHPVISGLAKDNPEITQQKANQNHNQNQTKKIARKRAGPLPDGFAISARVQAWAAEKNHQHLVERLEHFVSYAKRSGKTYADWDEALMTAIREDWAKLGASNVVPMARRVAV